MMFLLTVLTLGLIFSLLALAILISFRIFAFADITTDGSLTLGAAGATFLMLHGVPPLLATLAGFLLGSFGGILTAFLYTRCQINGLLAGILVIPSLYSISFRLVGDTPRPLPEECRLDQEAHRLVDRLGWQVHDAVEIAMLGLLLLGVVGVVLFLGWFFRTALGVAMRATGDNPGLVRSFGIEVGTMTILGLALANGLAGLTGALLVQYYGTFHLQIGVGMIVWGLASVLIGEALWPGKQLNRMLIRTVVGAILFRLILQTVLETGLSPSDLKLFSALFVLATLLWPRFASWIALMRAKANAPTS